MKHCLYLFLAYFAFTVPVFAGVTVSSPAKGDSLNSPFLLSASSTSCASHPSRTIGYSFDSSTHTTVFPNQTSIDQEVSASTGTHIVHVKVWTAYPGEVCVTDVPITITGTAPAVQTTSASSSSGSSNINVSTPSPGQTVASPFPLTVDGYTCNGRSVRTLGYSFDSGSTTIFAGQSSINTKASASAGTHTLRVKAWTATSGDVCVVNVPITVSGVASTAAAATSVVPSNAQSVSNIEVLGGWMAQNDSAVTGWSSGSMSLVSSPSHNGSARKFVTQYTNYGAERYSVVFGDDKSAQNIFYDAWVYVASPSSAIANLEFDVNQTIGSGQTLMMGVQCDGWSGKWAYTWNQGTSAHPKPHWSSSNAPCNPRTWGTNQWHHIQALYSHDSSGNVTYKYAWVDGVRGTIGVTVPDAFSLGWGSVMQTQFQVDGYNKGSGKATVYLDELKISRW